jgi:hypothetical protein
MINTGTGAKEQINCLMMKLKFILERIWFNLNNPRHFAWVLKTLLLHPQTPAARFLAGLNAKQKDRADMVAVNSNTLLFCYDLAVCPDTFDFIEFLAQAEIIRRKSHLVYLDVMIIRAGDESLTPDADYVSAYLSAEQRAFKVHEILLGGCRLMPSVRNIYFVNRSNAVPLVRNYPRVYPERYHPYHVVRPVYILPESPEAFFPMLQVPENAKKLVSEYLRRFAGRRVVTITLREYGYIAARNSNIGEWIRFARSLGADYQVIFIPDAYTYDSPFRDEIKGFEVFDAACWNLPIRAAIYEAAWMNLGVVAGPLAISLYLEKANTLFFYNIKVFPEDYWRNAQDIYKEEAGGKRRYLRFNNHYVYQEDSFEHITAEFDKLSRQLELLQGG